INLVYLRAAPREAGICQWMSEDFEGEADVLARGQADRDARARFNGRGAIGLREGPLPALGRLEADELRIEHLLDDRMAARQGGQAAKAKPVPRRRVRIDAPREVRSIDDPSSVDPLQPVAAGGIEVAEARL